MSRHRRKSTKACGGRAGEIWRPAGLDLFRVQGGGKLDVPSGGLDLGGVFRQWLDVVGQGEVLLIHQKAFQARDELVGLRDVFPLLSEFE